MNVTIRLDDAQCKAARHRAVDEGLSLSGWIGKVIEKELAGERAEHQKTLLELLGDRSAEEVAFDPPRSADFPTPAQL